MGVLAIVFGVLSLIILVILLVVYIRGKCNQKIQNKIGTKENLVFPIWYLKSDNKGSVGINVTESKGVKLYDNTIKGFDNPINIDKSKDVDTQRNKLNR